MIRILHNSLCIILSVVTLSVFANDKKDPDSVENQRRENACGEIKSHGKKTLCFINYDYNNTQMRCNQNDMEPGVLCSGIVFRGTDNDLDRSYYSWNPSPSSIKSGGVSFSYLRKDSKFNRLAYLYTTGFIFYPAKFTPKNKDSTIKILCGSPVDAGTDSRSDRGCGGYGNIQTSQPCIDQGIKDGGKWYDSNYQDANGDRKHICGFTLYSSDDSVNTSKMFESMIKAQILLKDASFSEQNELRLETWEQDKPNIPIEAFFYLSGNQKGLKSSQKDQSDFYVQFGEIIPIIELTLPSSVSDEVIFNYKKTDQSIT